ncbi:hypothetical protein ACK9YZ_00645 [Rhizobium sp. ZK1]|uniref:hypothetical protein n=1 Tax=Rhizobium sp. ZK1 TaxID=3389872 RepID=UPI0039F6A9FF
MILFFIYNKHFQVNGNIDPVDEGGKRPQAIEKQDKGRLKRLLVRLYPLLAAGIIAVSLGRKAGSDGKAEYGLQGSL